MSTVISAAELRAVLGVSSALYPDATLTDICDTAEQIIGPMLTQYKTFIILNFFNRLCKNCRIIVS